MAGAPSDADALYGLPLAEFTAARDALARRLREEGDRAGADAVKRLAKPTLAAWAVNQLARREGAAVDALLAAGAAVRDTQAAVLGGDAEPAALREATRAEREAVEDLVGRARDLLADAGRGEAALARVRETLLAAAEDDEAREELRAGRVTRERRPSGLGGFAIGDLPARPASRSRAAPREDPEEARRRREAQAAADAAARAVSAREAEAGRAAERAEAAERALERARAEAESAAQALEEARRRLDELTAES